MAFMGARSGRRGRMTVTWFRRMTNKSVTIIGAGPAGSAAALMLARRGWSVTLIEQHRFPRDKVCGECLSALGIEVATRLGFATALKNLGAVELTRTIL